MINLSILNKTSVIGIATALLVMGAHTTGQAAGPSEPAGGVMAAPVVAAAFVPDRAAMPDGRDCAVRPYAARQCDGSRQRLGRGGGDNGRGNGNRQRGGSRGGSGRGNRSGHGRCR